MFFFVRVKLSNNGAPEGLSLVHSAVMKGNKTSVCGIGGGDRGVAREKVYHEDEGERRNVVI